MENLLIITGSVKRFLVLMIFLFHLLAGSDAYSQKKKISDTLHLREIEIVATRLPVVPMETISIKNLTTLPPRDIGDFLRQEPNVSGIRKGGIAIDPVIRGFRFNQVTAILDNGITIEGGCPNRMDPVTSHVESEDVSKIELVKGPYVLKYGPVMGAMLNLKRDQPEFYSKPAIHGKVLYGFETNWNGQNEHAEIEGGNRFISVRASGGFKGYGSYTSGSGELFNTSFRKSYVNSAAAVKVAKRHTITLSYAYDQGNDVRYPALPMDERLDATNVASLNYQAAELGKTINLLEVRGYFTSVHHIMDNYNRPSAASMQAVTTVDAQTGGGNASVTINAGKVKLISGIDFLHIYKDGQKQMTMKMVMSGDTFTSVKYTNVFNRAVWNNAGLYGEMRSSSGRLDFTSSLRVDYNQANSADTFKLVNEGIHYFDKLYSSYLNLSVSAGIKIRMTRDLYFTASIGLGTRSPSILERFIKLMPVQYDSYDYLGNPRLKPEQNYQADVSIDYFPGEIGLFSAGCFFSLIHDYIIGEVLPPSVIKPSTQGAPGVKQFTNIDKAYLYGFEFIYRSPERKKWELLVNAAATWGTNPDAVKYLVTNGEVTGEEAVRNDPIPEIPPLEGALRFSYRFFKDRLIPGIALRMVAPQDRVSQAYAENSTPGFMTASVDLSYLPCRYFMVAGGISNIFNKNYYEHLNRRMVGSSSNLYEPGRVFYVNMAVKF